MFPPGARLAAGAISKTVSAQPRCPGGNRRRTGDEEADRRRSRFGISGLLGAQFRWSGSSSAGEKPAVCSGQTREESGCLECLLWLPWQAGAGASCGGSIARRRSPERILRYGQTGKRHGRLVAILRVLAPLNGWACGVAAWVIQLTLLRRCGRYRPFRYHGPEPRGANANSPLCFIRAGVLICALAVICA